LPRINTLAYWAHAQAMRKIKSCEYDPRLFSFHFKQVDQYFSTTSVLLDAINHLKNLIEQHVLDTNAGKQQV
jgi:hypothetical protein